MKRRSQNVTSWESALPVNAEIERILVNHCSPVLFGSKPAALFAVRTEEYYYCLMDRVRHFDNKASSIVLKKTENGFLVFFYKPDILNGVILERSIQKLLRSFGYPEAGFSSLQSYLAVLRVRFLECQEFPHEIGLFLGYPPEDVLGFIRQKGKNYKYCGPWKVYGSVKKAMDLFRHYDNCRERCKICLAGVL
jgi:hypothetical protein